MQEEIKKTVSLQGVDHKVMKDILDYMYTGKSVVNAKNADVMLSSAVYLQISSLQTVCENVLTRHMDIENCIDVLQLADMCSCSKLYSSVIKYVLQHFIEIAKRDKFESLTEKDIDSLIRSDDLVVPNEEVILEVIMKWFDKQSEHTEECLLNLLQHVRLNLISSEKLQRYLNENKHIKRFPECKKLVLQSTLESSNKPFHVPKQRRDEVMIVLQGSGYLKGMNLVCYSFQTQKWHKLAGIASFTPGCSYAVCVDDRNLYVSGGTNMPRGFYTYSLDTNTWRQLENMKRARSEHAMVVVNGMVYCIGGTMQPKPSYSSVDMFSLETNQWKKAGDLAVPTANAGCSNIDDKILVFGGTKSVGIFTHDIQCYNTATDQCTVISRFQINIMSGLLGLAQDKGTFYLTTADGKLVQYVPGGGDPEVIGIIHDTYLIGFGTVFYDGDILILGGASLKVEDECIRQYNIKSRRSGLYKGVKLPFERASNQYFGAIVMISKSYL